MRTAYLPVMLLSGIFNAMSKNEIQPVDLCLQAELDIRDILIQISEIERISFSDGYSLNTVQEAYYNDNYDVFVMLSKNEVLGYIIAYSVLDESEILRVTVKEEFKRKNIGFSLLSFAENSLKKKGIKYLILECRVSNSPADFLYKKSGFINLGIRRNFYENPIEDAIIMKKEI